MTVKNQNNYCVDSAMDPTSNTTRPIHLDWPLRLLRWKRPGRLLESVALDVLVAADSRTL